ncbi:MAG: wbpG2 [Bacteroidetes bacterium]|jgi:N-acetyl sugar amidotransferase|nr:wbpG2 [Bacteroidota bacterium]
MEKDTARICKRCVLDETAPELVIGEDGVCNFCKGYDILAATTINRQEAVKKQELNEELAKIKRRGEGKKYDCILGVSGGVDSTYLALKAKEWGLKPLVVHFDNGWNSEQAVKNIENIVNRLDFDLHTYVIDWKKFKDLQLSFVKASVLDLEVPTDQIIFSALYKIAKEHGIKTILSGHNISTESVLPRSWYADKLDYVNMKDIHKKYGTQGISGLPKLSLYHKYYYQQVLCITTVNLLNYVGYNKKKVKEEIISLLDWKDYGGKHYESIYTRFYQSYILPVKFNIDKRKAHLSNLVVSGQMQREEAVKELQSLPYDLETIESEKEYVAKKLSVSVQELNRYISQPNRKHSEFKTENDKGVRFFYFIFRLCVFIPVRILRLLRILETPNNPRFY